MKLFMSAKAMMLLPLLLTYTALVTPAYSNTFHGVNTTLNRNVGSAPNPTSKDIHKNRKGLHYPLESQKLNEEGTVGVKVSLTEQGRMNDAVVEKSSGFPRLDNAAIEYVKENWQYDSTGRDGHAIPAAVQVNVTFDMP